MPETKDGGWDLIEWDLPYTDEQKHFIIDKYSEDQPRDERGRFTFGDGAEHYQGDPEKVRVDFVHDPESGMDRRVWWHGSPSGDLRGGATGLHLGSYRAARQALEARIGIPADGKGWTGNREYGKTKLAGEDTLRRLGPYTRSGYNMDAPKEDYYPTEMPVYADGTAMRKTDRPSVEAYLLTGSMTNSSSEPHTDTQANALMHAQITRHGEGKRGYYYVNEGEDSGSISIVVPSAKHIEHIDREKVNRRRLDARHPSQR